MNIKALSGAALVAVGIGCIGEVARAAEAPDEVVLVDGTVLRGRVTQQAAGSYVVIQTDDGRVQSLPWSQIKRVNAQAPPPPPPQAPPPTVLVAPAPLPPPPPSPEAMTTSVEVHFEIGARAGYSFASGDYLPGLAINSSNSGAPGISGGFPLTLDLGARIARYVFIGGFASYGFLSTSCPNPGPGLDSTCDAHDVRAGIDVQFHLSPRGRFDPWVGLGLGREWLTVNESVTGTTTGNVQQTLEGWNFADLLLGMDFRTLGGFGFGPYLEITSGSFGSASTMTNVGGQSQTQSGDFSSTSSHEWFTLGVRGTYEVL